MEIEIEKSVTHLLTFDRYHALVKGSLTYFDNICKFGYLNAKLKYKAKIN